MNKRMQRIVSLFVVLILICGMLIGCKQESITAAAVNLKAENIDQKSMMDTIKELTSEKYKGRLSGSAENRLAAQYISDIFKKIGLENPKGLENYLQFFQIPLVELKDKPILQILDKNGRVSADFNYVENFVLPRLSSKTDAIDMEASLYLIKDYEELYRNDGTLKDKVILIPWKYYHLFALEVEPVDFAKICGAKAVIGEFDLSKNEHGYSHLKVTPRFGSWIIQDSYNPCAFVDSNTFAKLSDAARLGNKVIFCCNSKQTMSNIAANVIGLIPGSDPKLKDEYIIIGAHYDHVGDNMNGTYNAGALDNASGPAVMMELARVIKESKAAPKKSILFIAFDGESSGFMGSSYFCTDPIYPLDKAVMINLDMVGSAAKIPLSIEAAPGGMGIILRDTLSDYADKLAISYEKGVEGGSDHQAFAWNGVPAVCLINLDFKSGYHSPYDTIETVNGGRLKEITKLVLYYIENQAY